VRAEPLLSASPAPQFRADRAGPEPAKPTRTPNSRSAEAKGSASDVTRTAPRPGLAGHGHHRAVRVAEHAAGHGAEQRTAHSTTAPAADDGQLRRRGPVGDDVHGLADLDIDGDVQVRVLVEQPRVVVSDHLLEFVLAPLARLVL